MVSAAVDSISNDIERSAVAIAAKLGNLGTFRKTSGAALAGLLTNRDREGSGQPCTRWHVKRKALSISKVVDIMSRYSLI